VDDLTAASLVVTGDTTLSDVDGQAATFASLLVSGLTTLSTTTLFAASVTGALTAGSLGVTGLTTLSATVIDSLGVTNGITAATLLVTGLTTLSNTDVFCLTAAKLDVSGQTTLSDLVVTGTATLSNTVITGPTVLSQLEVTGQTTLSDTCFTATVTFKDDIQLDAGATTYQGIFREPLNSALPSFCLINSLNHVFTNSMDVGGGNSENGPQTLSFYTAPSLNTTSVLHWTIDATGTLTGQSRDLDLQAGHLRLDDNASVFFGTGNDAQIYYDGTNLVINPQIIGNSKVDIPRDLEVTGDTTLSDAWITNLQVSGLTTISSASVTTLVAGSLSVTGLTTLSAAQVFSLNATTFLASATLAVSGQSTLSQCLVQNNLVVGGLADLATLLVTGLSTLSITHAFSLDTDLLTLDDSEQIRLGTGEDATIEYDGSDLVVNPDLVGTGKLQLQGKLDIQEDSTGVGDAQLELGNAAKTRYVEMLRQTDGASVNFLLNNYSDQTTCLIDFNASCMTGSGATGTYRFGRQQAQDAVDHDNQVMQILNGATVYHQFETNGDSQFYVNGTGRVEVHTDLALDTDNGTLLFGAADDATILYNGTDLVINPKAVGSGKVDISGDLEADNVTAVTQVTTVDLVATGDTTLSGCVLNAGNLDIVLGYIELSDLDAPATPSAGEVRLFLNTATGKTSVRKDDGSTVSLEEQHVSPSVTTASMFMGVTLETKTVSGVQTFTFTGVPTGYDYLTIEGELTSSRVANLEDVKIIVNGDTTVGNYNYVAHNYGQGGHTGNLFDGTDQNAWRIPGTTSPAGGSRKVYAKIEGSYDDTSQNTSMLFFSSYRRLDPSGMRSSHRDYEWQNTNTVTDIAFASTFGSNLTGVLKLIGWKDQVVVTAVT
jgi:hypothetical protein